ncbi:unnamed protein product [Rhizoctonia solani]|uniref:FAD-binding FR-type domain-containing protein n=1 Tax=Rhizoctonia solani TaxID=456999 RepID=A0A8H3E7A9_9AGAM|nr:unnamed protein product [Rhizoctonia solani]
MTQPSSNPSGRAAPPLESYNSFDYKILQGTLAVALQKPSPIFYNPYPMRNKSGPYLTSGHSSNASIASTTTICSTTPIRSRERSWGPDDPEKLTDSNDNDLSQALADDIAALEPIENDYHRQRPSWLVSMIWAHQIWWIIAGVINIPFFLYVSKLSPSAARTNYIAQASLVNLAITVLVRNELLLAGLYWAFSKIPFRRFYAHRMLHSIGGLHVGCAFGTFIWIIFYTVEVARSASLDSPLDIGLLVTATILPVGITIIILFALRPLRERFHNIWEYTHRYVGWAVVADLVIHLGLKAATLDTPKQLFYTSLPYLTLACITSIFYIWFTVRRAEISIQANRSVAVVTFPGAPTMRSGTFARISRDGFQWHAFSVAMTNFEKREFSLIVGRAGDWTTGLINDALGSQGPERIYIRGVCPPGFMYMHHAYKKVVTVCTGAGIAPALPQIEQHTSDIMLIWIAKNHRETYGETVWNTVTSNLPANQVLLHDTGLSGRPDIGTLIERAAKAHGAEAVFVVSNDAYTNLCANICWRKGLRCYGATRDS